MTEHELWLAMIVQGFSVGLVFKPLTVMAYRTLSAQLRGEGIALQSLARNIGSAIGISVTSFRLTRQEHVNHADIAAMITPFDRVLQAGNAVSRSLAPASRHGAALLNRIARQGAAIIAYNNDFGLMMLTIVPPMLLLLLMRRHERPAAAAAVGDWSRRAASSERVITAISPPVRASAASPRQWRGASRPASRPAPSAP